MATGRDVISPRPQSLVVLLGMEPPIRSPVNYSQRFSLFLFRRRGFPIMGIPTPFSSHLGRAAGGEDALQIANLNSPSPANHQHALPLTFFFPPVASVYSCARKLITIVCAPPSILLFANSYSPSRHRADGILKALCIFTILSARNQSPVPNERRRGRKTRRWN